MEKVCIYNRCSTEEESQMNALEVQAQESIEFANKFKDWLIVDQFVESQSGTSTKGRSKYQAMMDGIESKRYTLILIKSIDRLVRNTKDWYLFLDCIGRNNVRLYIYMDNKFYSPEDSLITGIKAMLAAEFSRELSKKIKNAHKRRQNRKTGLNITAPMFGWDKVKKDVYVINDTEAAALREACDLLENGYGYGKLSKYMYNKGVRSKNDKMISEVQWRKMIRSSRMYGTVILHQYEYDFNTKKRIPMPKEEWIYIEEALPSIITKEHYDRLMEVLDKRAGKCYLKNGVNKIGTSDLSAKIFCGECGCKYHRRRGNYSRDKKITWICSRYAKLGRIRPDNPDGCNNRIIQEEEMKEMIVQAYREQSVIFPNSKEIIGEILRLTRKTIAENNNEVKIQKLGKEIDKILINKGKVFEKMLDGIVSNEDYKRYTDRYDDQIERLSKELSVLEKDREKYADHEQRIQNIKKELEETNLLEDAFQEVIIKKTESVKIYMNGTVEIRFGKNQVKNTFFDFV